MSNRKAILTIDGHDQPIELPILSCSVGPDVIDVGPVAKSGYFTYDPGFTATAACDSAITYIDGAKGILLHRGYPIDQLAENADYLDVCFLLYYGQLPSGEEKESSK